MSRSSLSGFCLALWCVFHANEGEVFSKVECPCLLGLFLCPSSHACLCARGSKSLTFSLQVERIALHRSIWRVLGSCGRPVLFQLPWRFGVLSCGRCHFPNQRLPVLFRCIMACCMEIQVRGAWTCVSEGGGFCSDVAKPFFVTWLPCCAICWVLERTGSWRVWSSTRRGGTGGAEPVCLSYIDRRTGGSLFTVWRDWMLSGRGMGALFKGHVCSWCQGRCRHVKIYC